MATDFDQSDDWKRAMTADSAAVDAKVAGRDLAVALNDSKQPPVLTSEVAGSHATVVEGHPPTVAGTVQSALPGAISDCHSKRSVKRARRRLRFARKDHPRDCY